MTASLKALQNNVSQSSEDLENRFSSEYYQANSELRLKVKEMDDKLKKSAHPKNQKDYSEAHAKLDKTVREMKDVMTQSLNELNAKMIKVREL